MQITAEYLTERKKEAEAERSRLLTTVQQITGAIGMMDILLRHLNEPDPQEKQEAAE